MVIRVIYQFCARYSVNFTENSVKKKVGRKKSKGRSIFGDRPKSRVVVFWRPTANTIAYVTSIQRRILYRVTEVWASLRVAQSPKYLVKKISEEIGFKYLCYIYIS